MPSPSPPPPLPDPEDDRRLAERRAARQRSATSDTKRPPARTRSAPTWTSKLSGRAWAIIIAAIVILVVVIVGTLISRDSHDKESSIKTDAAVSTLQSLLDGVQHDTVLGTCPFGSMSSIVGDVRGDLTFPATPTESTPMIHKADASAVDEVRCSVSTADDRVHASRTMYVYATPVPKGSYTDYLTKTLFDGAKVKLEDPVKHAGGTIYAYCLTPSADVKGGCGADWVAGDGSVVFGLQVSGGDVTAKQVTAALQHELATIVERFGSDATTSSTPSTDSTDSTGSTDPSGTTDTTVA